MPTLKLLLLYGHSVFGDLADQPDPARRQQLLAGHPYGLYLPFLDGVLEGLGPGGRLIDGNEPSYYYDDSAAFFRAYHAMRQGNLALVNPGGREAYRLRADAGMALYVDQVTGLRQPAGRYLSHYLDNADRLRWFEHNVYWALRTTDEYVWCYSERMNWWTGDYPKGLDEAIVAARQKLAGPPGTDLQVSEVLARGRAAMDLALATRLVRRTATVPWLAAGAAPPVIDGDLADPCWRAGQLDGFLPPVDAAALEAGATAWVVADAAALYLAVRCEEPRLEALVAAGRRRDDALWLGDTVELFCSLGTDPEPYVHLILNPENVRWDGRSGGANGDSSWDPEWSSAVARQTDAWTVELAVPWSTLGGRPEAGQARHANICRQRTAGGQLSAWSMIVQGFLEPAHFGVWEFAGQP
jgi:hypothetical protein